MKNQITFTKADMKTLKQYEDNLRKATYHGYARNLTRMDIDKIVSIYVRTTSIPVHVNYSCGVCQLQILQRVGEIYFRTLGNE